MFFPTVKNNQFKLWSIYTINNPTRKEKNNEKCVVIWWKTKLKIITFLTPWRTKKRNNNKYVYSMVWPINNIPKNTRFSLFIHLHSALLCVWASCQLRMMERTATASTYSTTYTPNTHVLPSSVSVDVFILHRLLYLLIASLT